MVEAFNLANGGNQIVLSPNQSLSSEQVLRALCTLVGMSMVVAVTFLALGVWTIIPFTLLEIIALGAAFYWVRWRQGYREVLTIDANNVRLEAGIGQPTISWAAVDHGFQLLVDQAPSWPRQISLYLCSASGFIEIGRCLNMRDKKLLVNKLRTIGVRVRHAGPLVCVEF